ncbi:glycosyltransferase [Lactococcus fujiensis]|uniref:Glycosyl transferase family 1 domain-containing protein n=1 Tax=Lactococcus fujiensis JCM 16395 TaxID=1291764 RepID=A0A2A5RPS4_9LACT|nr:glycosyltransferase [Lactococcus fujiensis]PCS01428.1 hypothetical protein RT41_GL000192 [Lactococcus fujiensis JCM 16395]
MKKIVLISSFYYPTVLGGSELTTKDRGEVLQQLGYDVTVITTKEKAQNVTNEIINGVKIIRLPVKSIYWSGDKKIHTPLQKLIKKIYEIYSHQPLHDIEKMIHEIEPDLIIMHSICMGFGTAIYELAKNYRVIQILHDNQVMNPTWNKYFNFIFARINRKRSKLIKEISPVSVFLGEDYQNAGFFPNAEVNPIFNVVNAPALAKKEEKPRGRKLKIGFFGTLARHKGIYEFIDSISLCPEIIEKVYIVGEDIEGIRSKHQTDLILFTGKVALDEVYKLMSEVDVIVMPSIFKEPFGRVIIEAYRERAIVISSNRGELPNLNIDKNLILEEITAEEIASKINLVYSNDYSLGKYEIYSNQFKDNRDLAIQAIERE